VVVLLGWPEQVWDSLDLWNPELLFGKHCRLWYNAVIHDSEGPIVENTMTAIETTGTIDENRRLQIDGMMPISGPIRVRVLVLYPLVDDWDEEEWLRAAARNPAFASLRDPAEDIYTLSDGQPFHDEA
jgi:hypothetical protein